MTVTLREIAEQARVSPALVSRVLNNKPGIWASQETRQRIRDVARTMNYQPSASARALVTGRTMQIAISSADKSWHEGDSGRLLEVSGIIDAAASNRYCVLVLSSPETHADRSEFEALLHSKICDGLCLYAEQADSTLYTWLQEHNIPFIVIGNPGSNDLPYADHDNHRYAYSSVQWLNSQGHQQIGWVSPNNGDPEVHHAKELKRGYTDAMRDICMVEDCWWANLSCRDAGKIAQTIGKSDAPTAVIVRGLASAMQWKMALQLRGIALPDDFALLAHLDPTELAFLRQGELVEGIACHLHNPRQVGQLAAQALIGSLEFGVRPAKPILVQPPDPHWCDEPQPTTTKN